MHLDAGLIEGGGEDDYGVADAVFATEKAAHMFDHF